MLYNHFTKHKGLSIVEVIVVSGIVAVFFTGLLSSFYYTVTLVQDSRARQSALTVANNQIEFIRSLAYDSVGTISGIPAGNIPQIATSTINNISFTTRTLIEYVDDSADGVGSDDSNGITTDYKLAKVTVLWDARGEEKEVSLISKIIPRSIETDVGGGTIRVNVFDSQVQPLVGASVRLFNNTMTPSVDITRDTNIEGVALFGGAPAGAGYELTVTKDGHSIDGTNSITEELINPATPPATVAEADITTLNFFIDRVSTVNINTVSSVNYEEWTETFSTTTGIVSSSGIKVNEGLLSLDDADGVFASSGNALLTQVIPDSLSGWRAVSLMGDVPGSTSRVVQVYSADAIPSLIPDSDLPGNSAGFTNDAIDISMLNIEEYSAISLGILLETNDNSLTPVVDSVSVSYEASLIPLPNVPLSIHGHKIIGTRGDATPVYKYANSINTDSVGEVTITNVEWDTYSLEANGYTIVEACSGHPFLVIPNTEKQLRLVLEPFVTHSLRVVVNDSFGDPVNDAQVSLSRVGYSETKQTSHCGQVSFLPLAQHEDYQLSVVIEGVEVSLQENIFVEGNEVVMIQL